MGHATPQEMLAVAEGVRTAASVPHLVSCEVCRAQVAELRAMVTTLDDVPVPEPPPLFWEQLASRVREAVATEPPPVVPLAVRVAEWVWGRSLPSAVAVCAALVLMVLVLPSLRVRPEPRLTAGPRSMAGPNGQGGSPTGAPTDEPSIAAVVDTPLGAFIEDLADDVDVEAAVTAGLRPERGAMDAAVSGLSSDEQLELRRLLQEALSGAGV